VARLGFWAISGRMFTLGSCFGKPCREVARFILNWVHCITALLWLNSFFANFQFCIFVSYICMYINSSRFCDTAMSLKQRLMNAFICRTIHAFLLTIRARNMYTSSRRLSHMCNRFSKSYSSDPWIIFYSTQLAFLEKFKRLKN
jgi:hypothetical protein